MNLTSRYFDVIYSPGARDLLKAGNPIAVPDSVVAELKEAAEKKKTGTKDTGALRKAKDTGALAVSDSVVKLFSSRTPSFERTVALMRLIEERKAIERSGKC